MRARQRALDTARFTWPRCERWSQSRHSGDSMCYQLTGEMSAQIVQHKLDR